MKIDKKTLRTAVLVSVGLHFLVFLSCQQIVIKGMNAAMEQTKKLFDVKIIRERIYIKKSAPAGSGKMESVLKFQRPDKSVLSVGAQKVQVDSFEKKDSFPRENEMIDVKPDVFSRDVVNFSEDNVKVREQRRVPKTESSEFSRELPKVNAEEVRLEADKDYLPAEFAKSMPGFTPESLDRGMKRSGVRLDSGASKNIRYQPGSVGQKYDQLDEYLIADLSVYQDPRDGQKYFRVTIMAGKDADKFKVLAKEIVFLVDCSLSIQPKRIEEFKRGLGYCLKNLNKGDKFNIISFRDKVDKMSLSSVSSEPATRESAERFIDALRSTESTDVYEAFSEVINAAPALKPSYILLLSDGKPTSGVVSPRDLIVKITRINKKSRPVFCFSGGSRVNRYLLDFISYRNRGWAEYTDRSVQVSAGLAGMYDKIKDPILLNLRYRFSHLSDKEVYPKELPDFYKGAAFTIYGKFAGEKDFSMQLLGEVDGVMKEFILTDSFSSASKGDYSIARQWAFNKIYYLIGELTEKGASGEIKNEINALCKKFNIKTPYSEEIE